MTLLSYWQWNWNNFGTQNVFKCQMSSADWAIWSPFSSHFISVVLNQMYSVLHWWALIHSLIPNGLYYNDILNILCLFLEYLTHVVLNVEKVREVNADFPSIASLFQPLGLLGNVRPLGITATRLVSCSVSLWGTPSCTLGLTLGDRPAGRCRGLTSRGHRFKSSPSRPPSPQRVRLSRAANARR